MKSKKYAINQFPASAQTEYAEICHHEDYCGPVETQWCPCEQTSCLVCRGCGTPLYVFTLFPKPCAHALAMGLS